MVQSDPDFKRTQSVNERTPTNVALKVELDKKERVKNKYFFFKFFYKKYFLLGNQ
jgi:hypothetical protein